jgi:phenylacetate-CoA ligase
MSGELLLKIFFKRVAATGYWLNRLDVFGRYEWLQKANRWSRQDRERWRLERLSDILEFAWKHVPFYREFWGDHGIQFRRPKSLDDLQKYPILKKDIFRQNGHRIQPENLRNIRFIRKHTGGSTSIPVHYLLDLDLWVLMEAFHLWGWSQAGYEFGKAIGVIAGGSLVPEKITWKARARSFAQRRLFLFGVAMDQAMAREYHARLVRYRAEFLYGYPSVIYLFAKHLNDQGLSLPRLKAVVTTAEMLQQQYRQRIQEWLRIPVFDNFGSNDGGIESYECRLHQGLHYNDLQSVLEVEPDATHPSLGRLLITNLWNRSTPFIRYENGDLVALSAGSCACGSAFPLIANIQGRTTDILTFSNGRSLSGPALTLIFGDMEIDGWQIAQTGPASLEVRLCKAGAICSEYTPRILRVLNHHLDNSVAISVRQVPKLSLTRGGKHKPVVNEMQSAIPLESIGHGSPIAHPMPMEGGRCVTRTGTNERA